MRENIVWLHRDAKCAGNKVNFEKKKCVYIIKILFVTQQTKSKEKKKNNTNHTVKSKSTHLYAATVFSIVSFSSTVFSLTFS